jgi:AcrR family transcriptional regulator
MATMATREQRKAETRERLLEAARRVFAARGYEGGAVDEIAQEAGFSSGAVYSNFDGKEDLFLELLTREMDAQTRALEEAVAQRTSVAERARGGAAEWMAFIEREPEIVMLFMEFWAYAIREPSMRPKVAARFAEVRAMLTRLIADSAREFGLELIIPAEQLAIAVDALADGIARQKLADPDAVPDDLLGSLVSLLVDAVTRPAAGAADGDRVAG